jgi:microcin C transport system permease protein
MRRGYYAFLVLVVAYTLSLLSPLLINSKALVVRYQGSWYFPLLTHYQGEFFGQTHAYGERNLGECEYRELRRQFAAAGSGDWVLLPPYPYHPNESLLHMPGVPPHPPSREHWLGTDDRARDIFARLVYGFRTSLTFALVVTGLSYLLGVSTGACLGYFGGRLDTYGQRLIEIWSGVPFLYTVIIISSIFRPSFLMLAVLLTAFGWMRISFYVRGEFLREKAKVYVAAARMIGERDRAIMFKHVLPNALTPVISFAPFAIVHNITALVSLDFLGFGLPPPTPSWGELIHQGTQNIFEWYLVVFPLLAICMTLLLTVSVGEAVREAFDPKPFSRLR